MISLRLPQDTESLVSQMAARAQLSRSEWIRRLIDKQLESESLADPHAQYLQLTAALPVVPKPAARSRQNATGHSAALRTNPKLDRRGAAT